MKKLKPEWEHASVEVSALPLQPGLSQGPCSFFGSKPGSDPIETSSPSGGIPGSQFSPHKCAWAWELSAEGPASSWEASSFAWDSLSLCLQKSRHLTKYCCFWSNTTAIGQAFPRFHRHPPGWAASGKWYRSSPGSHFWHWPPHGSSSLLQPNHQLLPERGRPKWQVKPQS